ncbi:MAG: MATE family efflux transporter [Alloprevotella sp.]|nr:MATE family efflux transporter [Alloprevotella sp.]
MHKEILKIALPSIATNVTVPLLALADMGISGHLGGAQYIGAVAVGAMIFNMLYWLCGFLRMSTGGLTAQAFGRVSAASAAQGARGTEAKVGDSGAQPALGDILLRSLTIAACLSLSLLLLQWPLGEAAFFLMGATPDVEALARIYFRILIWGAPAVLSVYCLNGWFLGRQDARMPMVVAIFQNLLNILLSLGLVVGLGWKVEGVATGTLIAQWTGLAIYACCRVPGVAGGDTVPLYRYVAHSLRRRLQAASRLSPGLGEGFRVEGTLFLRTLCMVAVQVWFTKLGAAQGDMLLAVNSLLMQFYMLFSYVMDGFAYAGEAVGGKYYGAGNRPAFFRLTRALFTWGAGLTLAFTALYYIGGIPFLSLLTDDAAIVRGAVPYLPYAWLLPLCGVATFLYDGLCIGTTSTRLMLVSVASGMAVFFLVLYVLPLLGGMQSAGTNGCLWIALLAFLAVRGLVQAASYSRIVPGR